MLTRYFSGIVLQISILFCIYTLALVKGGIENALLIAFLCSLFNIIPYLGPIIGAIIMAILTLTNYIGPEFNTVITQKLMYVMSGVVIGQLVDNFISQPFIFLKCQGTSGRNFLGDFNFWIAVRNCRNDCRYLHIPQ